jgi:hypothetical protein
MLTLIILLVAAILGRARHAIPVMGVLLIPLFIAWSSLPRWHRGQSEAAELCHVQTLEGRLLQQFSLSGLRRSMGAAPLRRVPGSAGQHVAGINVYSPAVP